MKVLLIWEEVPEKITLYSLEGELAELAIKAAGYYINVEENEAVNQLYEKLTSCAEIGSSNDKTPLNIAGHDKVVIAGVIL